MAEGVRYEEWMNDTDAVMWHIERDPLLRSTVLSVWVLDTTPEHDRFDATLDRAIGAIPRLTQRVVADRYGVAPPRWQSDPMFDPEYHIRRTALPDGGSERELLDLAAPIAEQAFDRDRPPWELHLVEGLDDGRAGVIMKLHHAMADGMGLVHMTEALIETSREPDPDADLVTREVAEDPAESPGELGHLAAAVGRRSRSDVDMAGRATRSAVGGMVGMARHPLETTRRAVETAGSVGRLVKPASAPLSPLLTERSMSLRLDVINVPFADLRDAGRAVDGTLNDAFVAAVVGGLRRYHTENGYLVDHLRMNMPINVRAGAKKDLAGNQFVPARFEVPMTVTDPAERMWVLHELMLGQRDEPALPLLDEVSGVISRMGIGAATRLLGGMMKSVDFVTSNVPGPPYPVYASGARIDAMYPFGPPAGAAVNVTLFSYDGQLHIGINSDRAAVPDPEFLVDCLQEGFDEVIAVG